MKPKLLFNVLFSFIIICCHRAQDKLKIKFGNVTVDDFKTKIYPIDSNASCCYSRYWFH